MEALKCLKVCQNHNMTKITTLVSSILKMEALKCLKVCQNHNMTKIKDKKLKLKKKKKKKKKKNLLPVYYVHISFSPEN
jgi:hypothetical protein